jgi:hypothetical protein
MEYDYVRQMAEEQLSAVAKEFRRLTKINEMRPPETRIACSTYIEEKDGRFIAVLGPAHDTRELFKEFFRRRPEFRSVIQGVLDEMYRVADR